jgi:hypothetical protein
MPQSIALNSVRRVMVSGLSVEALQEALLPTAALLPAYSAQESVYALSLVEGLARSGCVELCCIGPEAELLHDQIDEVLEGRGMIDVVTTFHTDEIDGCEYFLFAANGAAGNLLALIEGHPALLRTLKSVVDA